MLMCFLTYNILNLIRAYTYGHSGWNFYYITTDQASFLILSFFQAKNMFSLISFRMKKHENISLVTSKDGKSNKKKTIIQYSLISVLSLVVVFHIIVWIVQNSSLDSVVDNQWEDIFKY